jgi:hypothetical protein
MTLDDELGELWRANLSLRAIGERLGISRSAAGGRIARARQRSADRFPARPSGPRPIGPRKTKAKTAKNGVTNTPIKPLAIVAGRRKLCGAVAPTRAEPIAPEGSLLIHVGDGCLRPIGEDASGRHLFCGRGPRAPGSVYCSKCKAVLAPRVSASPSSSSRAPRSPSPAGSGG